MMKAISRRCGIRAALIVAATVVLGIVAESPPPSAASREVWGDFSPPHGLGRESHKKRYRGEIGEILKSGRDAGRRANQRSRCGYAARARGSVARISGLRGDHHP